MKKLFKKLLNKDITGERAQKLYGPPVNFEYDAKDKALTREELIRREKEYNKEKENKQKG